MSRHTLLPLALLSLLVLITRVTGNAVTYVDFGFARDVDFSPSQAWRTGSLSWEIPCPIADVVYSTVVANASLQFNFTGAWYTARPFSVYSL